MLRAKDSATFWSAVRKIAPVTQSGASALEVGEIYEHFRTVFNSAPILRIRELSLSPRSVPALDTDVSLKELDCALLSCKRGKALGEDGVQYEFYMNLNVANRNWLLDCLNGVLRSEEVPASWAELKMFLLHKKGDASTVANYRGISLLNCIAKVFTSIIARRINSWAEEKSLLPEAQAGFRSGRSCSDNLFVLQTAIHEQIRTSGNSLFCTFVDFKQAFDSVNHNVLWQKLARFGLSSKLLRILSQFYSQAKVRVHHGGNTTPAINIANGVLQGDCLSPLLFSLLVADFETFLDEGGVDGVGIGPSWELKYLFYADDLVLLARNKMQMQKALNCLQKFCDINHLTVNTDKTKVVIFRARCPPLRCPLFLNGAQLEVVKDYPYLGVIFSSNGKFTNQLAEAKRKCQLAAASTRHILCQMGSLSRKSEFSLFQAKICSTLLYGAECWGPWCVEAAEQIQLQYYKRLFFLHPSTPGYVIRHFFGIVPQACRVLERCLKWYNRVLCMWPDRWPRKCLDRLLLREADCTPAFNWVTQIGLILQESGVEPVCQSSGLFDIQLSMTRAVDWYKMSDARRCVASEHCPYFGNLVALGSIPELPPLNLREMRLALQILLQNRLFQSLFWKGEAVTFNPDGPCPSCRMGTMDTVSHMLEECPVYAGARGLVGLQVRDSADGSGSVSTAKLVKLIKASWPVLLQRVPLRSVSHPVIM